METIKSTGQRPRVLDGVRVVDLSHILAGPYCARILCDLGAEVIKVEPVITGELSRSVNLHYWWFSNYGKKGLSLDLTKPEGLQIIKDLIMKSDVVVDNFRAGIMEKLGLSYDNLKKINPRLIACSITGFGQYGPNRDLPATNPVANVMSGLSWWQGQISRDDKRPTNVGFAIADTSTGVHAAVAICAALYYREQTGRGQYIDICLLDSLVSINDKLQRFILDEMEVEQLFSRRSGQQTDTDNLIYAAKDGYMVVQPATQEQWVSLARAMGKPELIDDKRFSAPLSRSENMTELNGIISNWVSQHSSRREVLDILERAGVICAPILSYHEAINQPHMSAHDMIVEAEDPERGMLKVINTPYNFSDTDSGLRGRLPRLGEHNVEILATILGYSDKRIAELYEKGVIYSDLSGYTLEEVLKMERERCRPEFRSNQ